ncbi:MAG: hypothetical protein R3C49_19260 [Planctomycetaceae bacterium]
MSGLNDISDSGNPPVRSAKAFFDHISRHAVETFGKAQFQAGVGCVAHIPEPWFRQASHVGAVLLYFLVFQRGA